MTLSTATIAKYKMRLVSLKCAFSEVYSHHPIAIQNLMEFLIESGSFYVQLLDLLVPDVEESLLPVVLILK